MKISMINSFNYAKNQNFRGLWGQDKRTVDDTRRFDEAHNMDIGCEHTITEKTYHPFKGETLSEIEKVKEENTKTVKSPNKLPALYATSGYVDATSKLEETTVNIGLPLSFTEAQYKAYLSRQLLSTQELEMEDEMKSCGLQSYLLVPPRKM